MSNKKLGCILFIIVLLVLLLIVFLILPTDNLILSALDNKNLKDTPRFEILKSLFNVLFIIIIGGIAGGIVSIFFKDKNNALEHKHNEERKDFLNRLKPVYSNVNFIRRSLSNYFKTGHKIQSSIMTKQQKEFYCRKMEELKSHELPLASLKIDAESIPAIKMIIKDTNSTLLSKMIDYLSHLIIEYEEKGTEPIVKYSLLIKLDEFICPEGDEYIENFSKPFEVLKKMISDNLI